MIHLENLERLRIVHQRCDVADRARKPLAHELVAASRDPQQFLLAFRADRRDESAAFGQLVEQFLRQRVRRCGQQYAVEWFLRRPTLAAVAMFEAHILDLEFAQALTRPLEQRLDALDAVDPADERREHRRLVAAAGPDLEHLIRRASDGDRLRHARNDVGLGNRLAMPDRQRGVLVRAARQRLIHE